ncbi:hypothetical protein Zmor_009081 [Zophobas morio]|jgi:hypothetical protein|uniref:Uncharacterized protein n=1 Tax=Zophobas morio TaxID=2755281 RepID=A0AA38LYZ8_9CUCU|nr:hypothetical protein Zmor_009081 [Zophobas morio]
MIKYGLVLDRKATHACFELVKIDLQLNRNVKQAFFLSRGKEQEFAERLYFSETNIPSEFPQSSSSLEGRNSPDEVLRKRVTEVRRPYAPCNATRSRPKVCKIASDEEPLDIFGVC